MKEGSPEKIDPEYIRHGTSGIIASRDVATDRIVEPMIQSELGVKDRKVSSHVPICFRIA
jgi:hypothetical protein